MNDIVKEPVCARCAHSNVCMYKNEYLSILKAVLGATVHGTRIDNFCFVKNISVECRYCQDLTTTYRGITISNDMATIAGTAKVSGLNEHHL